MSSSMWTLLFVFTGFLLFSSVTSYTPLEEEEDDYHDEHGGKYCSRRPGEQCCPGRNDQCTMPFEDTLCYCDIFCNRTWTDCCPDFLGLCMGIHLPRELRRRPDHLNNKDTTNSQKALKEQPSTAVKNNCYHEGKLYNPGDEIKPNCNNCTCVNAVIKEEYNWKCTQKICIVRQPLLQFVNDHDARHTWTASNYSFFWGKSLDTGVKYWLGTRRPTSQVNEMSVVKVYVTDDLPDEFDAREEWPGLITPVLDQGRCGSSWAFSTAGVASDRLNIHSNGVYKHTLSPQHIISCNIDHGQHGCKSGHIDRAWWFIRKFGIVNLQCYPYISGKSSDKGICSLPRSYASLKDAKCPSDGSSVTVFQASPPYKIASNENEIMQELMENGPLQAVIEVREDFFLYKSGVYQHTLPEDYLPKNLRQTDFHSVRLLGWGTDYSSGNPIKYWLCANSWGSHWGEDGYFRILRGTDESSIESNVVGVWIKVNDRMLVKKRTSKSSGHRPGKEI